MVGLLVAGFDPSGGAGILLDTRVFKHFGVHAVGVITALTVQNSCGAYGWEAVDFELFKKQLEFLISDFPIGVVKVGMLAKGEILEYLTETLKGLPFVVDPVMFSKNGKPLLDNPNIYKKLAEEISLITPNLDEAKILTGLETENPYELLSALGDLGFKNILLKGGHFDNTQYVVDYLLTEKGEVYTFDRERFKKRPRGTGCALSSAVAANLLKGFELPKAFEIAEKFLTEALEKAQKPGRCHEILIF